ncbi:MAG TPA: VCBS repeat-containing protein [Gaiellaceae bacterium]|nr:VCBS repeat-containing protein [Gaiellaceae bacterium]
MSRRTVAVGALAGALLLLPAAAGPAHAQHRATACTAAGGRAPVRRPTFVRNLPTGETGWFSSPSLVDLNGDGRLEIVAPFYSTFVFASNGRLLAKGTATKGRVYAPGVVADLDGDKIPEIVVGGNDGTVAAYDFVGGKLRLKPGWPASTCSGGQCPEVRGMAAADLAGDGHVEVVVTTTNTSPTGSQVFVFDARGRLYRPKGAPATAWPRFNTLHGAGNDAGFNGVGNHGYGAYGENVGIGNLDDDPQLEIVVTFDNHQINVFNDDGTSVLASPWFTNRQSGDEGRRLGWGQFVRWLDPTVEANQYHRHVGPWPDIRKTPWLQWTASPPTVADLDGDGANEVIGVPNVELHEPYVTQSYAFMAFDGAQHGGARSAMRHKGFVHPPTSSKPAFRPDGDWYPPSGIPAPTVVNLVGDARPEIVAAVPDGFVYAVSPTGKLLWRFDYAHGAPKTFASEVVAADLNRDGTPELVFGTYGLKPGSGHLVVLSATGKLLYDIRLPHQGTDGNGIGVPAAPSIGDTGGDGTLEIVLTTFDHGIDVFHVPGSGTNCLPWPTGRANLLRNGMGPATAA